MAASEQIEFHNVRFGKLTANKEDLILFSEGLPGFERFKRYAIVEEEEELPFQWLLSVEEPYLGFMIVDPLLICPDYNHGVSKEDLKGLDVERSEDLRICSIVTLSSDPNKITVNLKGSIFINVVNRKAKQVVLMDDTYSTKHPILGS